ncbi:competence/damage-inducible protein-like protein cinA [Microthyrium microscopicum]|uniref:Competence/damage-inducible protein-like protein cinA n=1 Tax=Microthyrium microscopicum TaxID=703497 RepID=A0A6A6U2U3_9PEZI|nr:competence/damage-inducible protein-like protein cinA [Microthyrium microscopicum]
MDTTSKTFLSVPLQRLAEDVAKLLKEKGATVSVVESAAGGIISASLLAITGASAYHRGGLTLYSLQSRIAYSGWTEADVATYKGPTKDNVGQMAKHVRAQMKSSYTLGESGYAGPTGIGSSPNRQPGFVALAVASEEGTYGRELNTGSSDRAENMLLFAGEALKLLKDVLMGNAKL